MKRLRRLVGNWFRTWAIIDISVLGAGILLMWGYVDFREHNPDVSNGLVDLWPNVATEIVAIYLGVRFIDSFISWREQRENRRHFLMRNLNYLREQSQSLLPYIDSHRVDTLNNELGYIEEQRSLRYKYVDKSEQADLEVAYTTFETLCKAASEALQTRLNLERMRATFYHVFDDISDQRKAINDLIGKVSSADKDKQSPLLNELLGSLEQILPYLRPSEVDLIKNYCSRIDTTGETDRTYQAQPHIEYFSRSDIRGLSRLEDIVRSITQDRDFDHEEMERTVTTVHENFDDVPASVKELIEEYIEAGNTLLKQRQNLEDLIVQIAKATDVARRNLEVETPIF